MEVCTGIFDGAGAAVLLVKGSATRCEYATRKGNGGILI